MAQRSSLRAAERAAREALASAEQFKIETRVRALQRLSALIDGCILELEDQRPAPPPSDAPGFQPLYC